MFKLHLYNLLEKKEPTIEEIKELIIKGKHNTDYHKPIYVIEIISNSKILAYIDFKEHIDFLSPMFNRFDFLFEEMEVFKQNFISINDYKITNNFIKNTTPALISNKKGVRYLYKFFSNNEFEEHFYKFFSFNFPIVIKDNLTDEIEPLGQNRNVLINKELQFLINKIDLPYGLSFYLLKNKYEFLNKFIETQNIKKLNHKHVNIQNNNNSLFTEKNVVWRSNRTLNILNLSNVQKIDLNDVEFFQNFKNGNFYLKINEDYFKIKILFNLIKKNLANSYEKVKTSTEILFLIEAFKQNNQKYLARVTKSSSKTLVKSLKEITFEDFNLNYILKMEEELKKV